MGALENELQENETKESLIILYKDALDRIIKLENQLDEFQQQLRKKDKPTIKKFSIPNSRYELIWDENFQRWYIIGTDDLYLPVIKNTPIGALVDAFLELKQKYEPSNEV